MLIAVKVSTNNMMMSSEIGSGKQNSGTWSERKIYLEKIQRLNVIFYRIEQQQWQLIFYSAVYKKTFTHSNSIAFQYRIK